MIHIQEKTLKDIEFYTVLQQVSEGCVTHLGTEQVLKLTPYTDKETLIQSLNYTNEYLSSLQNENRIPNHGFEPITKEIQLLKIDNSFLETSSFKKIIAISITSNEIITFLKKFAEYYTHLHQFSSSIEVTKVIINEIDAIVDRFGDVKDKA